jgi:hypothetical protein
MLGLLTAVVAACGAADQPPDEPALRLTDTPNAGKTIEVSGLSASTIATLADLRADRWPDVLAVYTADAADDPQAPPMLGEHHVAEGTAVFAPRFPFAPGMSYVARYTPPGGGSATELQFHIDAIVEAGETRVDRIYPSADRWPMNQLKMYIHFSAPMRAGRAMEHIRLIDVATGDDVEQPFVTVQEELWGPDHRVLTVLYDPARIKRGLVPNQQAGLPLQTGRSYRLVVDSAWRDAAGQPLAASFERSFEVGDLDRTSPHPGEWSISLPPSGTTDPLTIDFGEPLDHGLLRSLIGVRRAASRSAGEGWRTQGGTTVADELAGTIEVADAETTWRFHPATPWAPGDYEIVVPAMLEDLAGNTLKGLFDAEVGSRRSEFADAEAAFFGFRVGR